MNKSAAELSRLFHADENTAQAIRSAWSAEANQPRKENPVSTITVSSTFLNELVQQQRDANEAQRIEAEARKRAEAREKIQQQNAELRSQFKQLLERGAATVSEGKLHFVHEGTQYQVSLREGRFILSDGSFETSFTAEGNAVATLVRLLAQYEAKQVSQ
jgi:hypothetical protein